MKISNCHAEAMSVDEILKETSLKDMPDYETQGILVLSERADGLDYKNKIIRNCFRATGLDESSASFAFKPLVLKSRYSARRNTEGFCCTAAWGPGVAGLSECS